MILADRSPVMDLTHSLCPICLQVVEAQVIARDGKVYLQKQCPDHGSLSVYLWPDVDHYKWINDFRLPAVPATHSRPAIDGCPNNCGLCTSHLRFPTLIEVEVTQRCNLRCPVCFMDAGNELSGNPSMQSLESMFTSIREQVDENTSLQLTGGEPTVRPDLVNVVSMARQFGFQAIEINTNGIEIAEDPDYLLELIQAGISGIYLQFDGLSDDVYCQVRGIELLSTKMQAIENCRATGVQVVLAMTVIQGINHNQIGAVLEFALGNLDVIAGLALQPAFTSGRFDLSVDRKLSMGDVVFMLAEQSHGLIEPYDLWPLGCSHPLCSCATQLVVENGSLVPVTRHITRDQHRSYFNAHSPQGSVFADILSRCQPDVRSSLSILIMNYMDAETLDLKRLRECSMTVSMLDGRQIPFCAYQISNQDGVRLHPAWGVAREHSHDHL